jgi:hypothetical protein
MALGFVPAMLHGIVVLDALAVGVVLIGRGEMVLCMKRASFALSLE